MMTAKHIIFTGWVQGVGFRFTAHRIARRHGLAGFVRNLSDGSVEMLVQGEPAAIEVCLAEIEAALPGHIRQTDIEDVPPDPRLTDFRIAF